MVVVDNPLEVFFDLVPTGAALYAPVFDAAGELVDFRFARLNPAGQRLLDLPAQPPLTFREYYPNSVPTGIFAQYRTAYLTGEASTHEVPYAGDGLDTYFRLVAQRSGELLVVNFTDLADLPRAGVEQSLRDSQARERAARAAAEAQRAQLQALLAQAPVAIALLQGPQLLIASANERIATLWGRTPAQVVGQPLLEAVPELHGQGFDDLLRQVLRTQVPVTGTETPVRLLRGEALHTGYYNFVYQPHYDAEGEVVGVLAMATEVTEQVLARQQVQGLNEELAAINEELRASNEEYQRANVALSETQQQLRQLNQELETRVQERSQAVQAALAAAERERTLLQAVLTQAPVAIGLFQGEELRIRAATTQLAAMWGRAPEQVLDQPFLDAVSELRGQGFDEQLRQVLRTQVPVTGSETPATMLRDGRLQTTYYDFIYQPLYDADGRVLGVIDVAVEVTEQVLARQQVQALNEELAAINEELTATNEELNTSNTQLTRTNVDLDTFVYTASHDLKAPITNIESIALALRETLPAEVQQDELIAHLLSLFDTTVARFRLTIGQLTDISRLQLAHNGPAEFVRLAQVVADLRLDLAPDLVAADTQLTVEVPADLVVSFSPANLRSIVYNLLSNAVKYRALDRPSQVRVHAEQTGQHIVLSVHDNGLGMSEVQQRQLFGLFQRLHTHVEGTGVGLFITKRLIENAGGTIAVRSQPGVGTTFTVSFPH